MSCRLLLTAVLIGAWAGTQGQAQAPPHAAGDQETLCRAAITAYAANLASFHYYKCRYRVTHGEARSVEDAIKGKFINARAYDNRLIVDGEKDFYEGSAPPPDPKLAQPVPGKAGKFIVRSPGNTDRYLSDGKREMNYLPPMGSINLFPEGKMKHGVPPHVPLSMCQIGHRNEFGPDVLLWQPEKYEFVAEGLQDVDGRPLVSVRFTNKEVMRLNKPLRQVVIASTFSFDPANGYLPVRMVVLWNDKPKIQVFVTNVREVSNQRWFPERTVCLYTPDSDVHPFAAHETKLLELDADNRPKASEFAHTIPAGTQVSEFGNERGLFFTLKQDETIHVEDLPTLFEMLEKSQTTPLMDTAVPHTSPNRWLLWAGGAAGLALLLGGFCYRVRRRRRLAV